MSLKHKGYSAMRRKMDGFLQCTTTGCCSKATTTFRLAIDHCLVPKDSFSVVGDLEAWWRQGMSKRGTWGSGALLSAMLEGWEKTVRAYRRFAVRVVDQSRTMRRENSCAVARPTNDFKTVEIDLGGGIAEFEEFTKAMRIGDRVRAFCNDGVIEAEKVSQTRFKLIYNLETTGPSH